MFCLYLLTIFVLRIHSTKPLDVLLHNLSEKIRESETKKHFLSINISERLEDILLHLIKNKNKKLASVPVVTYVDEW